MRLLTFKSSNVMNNYDKETLKALERAINTGNECYYAFNHLSVVTKVEFRFYATELYDALKLCQAWAEKIREKGE